MPGLLSQLTPAMTVGGTNLYQQAPYVDPSRQVYRPQMNRSGLLNDSKANDLIKNFAGGLLGGYQYNPTAGMDQAQITPTSPSGVFTADPSQGDSLQPLGGSGLSFRDAIEMRYGPGDAYGGDADVFLSNLLGNQTFRENAEQQWGASLDDPYGRDSGFWQNLQEMIRRTGNIWQGRGDNGSGGSGESGVGGGAGSGGAP